MVDEPDEIIIPYMLLADSAEAIGGKLYVLGGGWDRIMIPNLPARSPKPFVVALGITVPYTHTNRKFALALELLDADGAQIGEVLHINDLQTGRPVGLTPGTPQTTPLTIMTNPEFPGPGRYSFVAHIDGQIRRTVSFEVLPIQQLQFVPPQQQDG